MDGIPVAFCLLPKEEWETCEPTQKGPTQFIEELKEKLIKAGVPTGPGGLGKAQEQ